MVEQQGPSSATKINLGSHHKLEFSKFEGDDFHGWVMQVECFFEVESDSATYEG